MTYPSPLYSAQAFVTSLLDYLTQNPHECLFVVKEESLDPILKHRYEFEAVTRLPFVDNATFQICRDKRKTIALAVESGVPHPKTIVPSGPKTLLNEAKPLDFPVVIKPCRNCAGEGIRFAQNETELLEYYNHVHALYPFPLVQEAIPGGDKYDVCCLFDENSRSVATFVQREIRCYPLQSGPSTLQESVWWPELADMTLTMLQKANWYGIAEAEYIVDPRDGTPKLLEINPRFWGSMQLAIQCGVDFPYLLYRLALGERIEPVETYQVGQMCRQLLPYDILHFLVNSARFRMEPSFFDFFNPHCRFNLISAQDPGPVGGFFLACGRYIFDLDMWRRLARIDLADMRLLGLLRRWAGDRGETRGLGSNSIVLDDHELYHHFCASLRNL